MELVVNVNYRGRLKTPINLKTIAVGKYYTIPHQVVIKDEKGTLIFLAVANSELWAVSTS